MRSLASYLPGGLDVPAPTGSFPGYAAATAAAGCEDDRRTRSFLTAARSRPTWEDFWTPARSRCTSTGVFRHLSEAAAAHVELEKGHTRGKIVLRVSDHLNHPPVKGTGAGSGENPPPLPQ